jgi:hypothetical protein
MQTLLRCAVAVLLLAGFLTVGASTGWSQPTLTAVTPQTLSPGAATEITVTGTNLVDPLQVWTSFPSTVEVVPVAADAKAPTSRTIKVTAAADTPLSLGGILVGTPAGATDVKLVMIDELPNQKDSGKNHTMETAQVIPARCSVEGATDSVFSDFYRIAVKQGQLLSVEVYASRIQSTVDPLVRLLDASGTELASADDDAGLGSEARLSWTAKVDGEVVVELRDSQYRAAGSYIMRVGDFPLVTTPYPLGARTGSTVAFGFVGPKHDTGTETTSPRFLRIGERIGKMSVEGQLAAGQAKTFSEVVVSPFPEFVESEPNGQMTEASSLVAPCAINGRFESAGDQDCYRFVAVKGQAIRFEATSRSAGSPAMVFLRVYDAAGKTLKETAVNDRDEWSVDFAPPADGVYYLMAEDLLHRGGSDFSYRVAAKLDGDFQLAVKHDATTKLQLASSQNGGIAVTVQCVRQGYTGAVKLRLVATGNIQTDIPLRIINDTIPAGAAEHRIMVETIGNASIGLHSLRIVGYAVGAEPSGQDSNARTRQVLAKDVDHVATTQTTLRTLRPQTPYPHSSIDGLLAVAVVGPTEAFFGLKPAAATAAFDPATGEAKFDVTVERTNKEYKEAVFVLVDDLPEGFSATVKAEKDVYHVTVKGPKDASGTIPVKVLGYGQFKGKGMMARPTVNVEAKK